MIDNGRDDRGRFTDGNSGGPGNPHGGTVARMRAALLEGVTEDDLREIVAVLVEKAKAGDARAIRELLDRVLGRPCQALEVQAREGGTEIKLTVVDGRKVESEG